MHSSRVRTTRSSTITVGGAPWETPWRETSPDRDLPGQGPPGLGSPCEQNWQIVVQRGNRSWASQRKESHWRGQSSREKLKPVAFRWVGQWRCIKTRFTSIFGRVDFMLWLVHQWKDSCSGTMKKENNERFKKKKKTCGKYESLHWLSFFALHGLRWPTKALLTRQCMLYNVC